MIPNALFSPNPIPGESGFPTPRRNSKVDFLKAKVERNMARDVRSKVELKLQEILQIRP